VRKRSPIVLAFIAAAVVLAGLLVFTSARRATTDASANASVVSTTAARSPATTAPRTTANGTTANGTTAKSTTTSVAAAVTAPRGMASVRVSALPAEARTTLALIDASGPFPYSQDGVVFQNREGILPKKSAGYYHEYTVKTPGSTDRGARRIVVGTAGERYYTDDHYDSFRLVVA
jgi:ribonuclease T1